MKNVIKILLTVPTLLIDNALYWGRFWWDTGDELSGATYGLP